MSAAHGVDIASQWTDELDLEALRFAVSPKIPKRIALDLGCGAGTQGVRSLRQNGYLAEFGPNTILETSPKITQLIRDAGLEFRRLDPAPRAEARYVVRYRRPIAMPASQ